MYRAPHLITKMSPKFFMLMYAFQLSASSFYAMRYFSMHGDEDLMDEMERQFLQDHDHI